MTNQEFGDKQYSEDETVSDAIDRLEHLLNAGEGEQEEFIRNEQEHADSNLYDNAVSVIRDTRRHSLEDLKDAVSHVISTEIDVHQSEAMSLANAFNDLVRAVATTATLSDAIKHTDEMSTGAFILASEYPVIENGEITDYDMIGDFIVDRMDTWMRLSHEKFYTAAETLFTAAGYDE